MQTSPSPHETRPIPAIEQESFSSEEKQRALMWLLLLGGIGIVCLAEPLGLAFVPRHSIGPGVSEWSPDDAHHIATTARILGCMAFAAGLVERLAVTLSGFRSKDDTE